MLRTSSRPMSPEPPANDARQQSRPARHPPPGGTPFTMRSRWPGPSTIIVSGSSPAHRDDSPTKISNDIGGICPTGLARSRSGQCCASCTPAAVPAASCRGLPRTAR